MFLHRPLVVRLLGLVLVPLSLLAAGTSYVRLNISPSLPYGLYRLHPVARPLTRGTLVIVHVPGWSVRTRPFLKPVAAVAGEWVCRVGPALVIDHEDYGPVYETWRGEPLTLRDQRQARLADDQRPGEGHTAIPRIHEVTECVRESLRQSQDQGIER